MRIHFYVHVEELEYLNKILAEKIEAGEYQISIAPTYFENSYLVDISYDDFIRLNDNNTFTTLISL
jgi:hypothetical protein